MAACVSNNQHIEIIVGTYEEYILGYQLQQSDDGSYHLQNTFSNHNHIGSVRCLAISNRFLASGGTDEIIYLFDMKKRRDLGSLTQHEGTITCLAFFKNTHLFSGSEDGTIAIYSTSSWQCEKVLRGHKKGVVHLSIHPSGTLLLSVGKDKSLRTWNLIKGRSAYVTNLKAVAEFVHWSPDESHFIVGIESRLDVYSVDIAGVVHSIDFGKRIACACFLTENVVVLGGGQSLELHDIKKKCVLHMFSAHNNRVKDVRKIDTSPDGKIWLTSVSSDGYIKIWEHDQQELDKDPVLVVETNTTCRPICLTAVEINSS